jgi:hypothetical protein
MGRDYIRQLAFGYSLLAVREERIAKRESRFNA